MDLSDPLARYLPAIENQLLQKEKSDSSPQGHVERLLSTTDPTEFQKACVAIGLDESKAGSLWINRVIDCLESEAPTDTKKKFLEGYIKQEQVTFDQNNEQEGGNHQAGQQQKQDCPDEAKYSLSKFIRSNEDYLYSLSAYGLSQLTLQELTKLNKPDLHTYLNRSVLSQLGADILPLLKLHCSRVKTGDVCVLEDAILGKLTIDQLQRVVGEIPELANDQNCYAHLFRREFAERLPTGFPNKVHEMAPDELLSLIGLLDETRKRLTAINKQVIKPLLQLVVLKELAVCNLLRKADMGLLQEYLNSPVTANEVFDAQYRNSLKELEGSVSSHTFWASQFGFGVSAEIERNTIWTHLKLVLEDQQSFDGSDVSSLCRYFGKKVVGETWESIRRIKGRSLPVGTAFLSDDELSRMRKKKQLTILNTNQKSFKANEEVVLKLTLQNLKEVTADIYQINTERHCLSSSKPIAEDMDLQCVQPNATYKRVVDCSDPFKEYAVEWSFKDSLRNAASIYIIDFRSEQYVSRAIIRRGSIRAKQTITLVGLQLQFLSEEDELLTDVVVWQNGTRFEVKDTHIIPFGSSTAYLNLVVCHNGYAEKVLVVVPTETYEFKIGAVYDQQGFKRHHTARVLIQARLTLAGHLVSLTALKKCRIEYRMQTDKGMNHVVLEDIRWSSKDDYVLEIPMPSHPGIIFIAAHAEAARYSSSPQSLEAQYDIEFEPQSSSHAEFHLHKSGKDYVLSLLGLVGEPIADCSVQVSFGSALFSKSIDTGFKTNAKGEIVIGSLSDVRTLSARVEKWHDPRQFHLSQKWRFQPDAATDYPSEIKIAAGEECRIPLPLNFDREKQVKLIKVASGNPTFDQTHRIKTTDGQMAFTLERKGMYELSFLHLSKKIHVVVEQSKSAPLTRRQTHQLIGLKNIQLTDTEQQCEVTLELSIPNKAEPQHLDDVKVHIITSAFIHSSQLIMQLRNRISYKDTERSQQEVKKQQCSYLNSKQISEEHCYVLQRQSEQKFIGSNLSKPSLLLKPIEARQTNFQQQKLAEKQQFAQNKPRDTKGGFMEEERRKAQKKKQKKAEESDNVSPLGWSNLMLKHSSTITGNIHGQVIKFTVPKHHRHCRVILTSPFVACEASLEVPHHEIPMDCRKHRNEAKDAPDTGIGRTREMHKLSPGEALTLPASSQWTVADGTTLLKYATCQRRSWDKSSDWMWILQWHRKSDKEKLAIYDQYCCHELNIYIKYSDPSFFKKYIVEFLQNKLQKTVVDLCLLNDEEALSEASPEKVLRLNKLEICLLIDFLAQNGHKHRASQLFTNLKQAIEQNKSSAQLYKVKFDSIVQMKALSAKQRSDHGGGGGGGGGGDYGGGGGGGGQYGGSSDNEQDQCQFDARVGEDEEEAEQRGTVEKMMFDMRDRQQPSQDMDYEKQAKLYEFLRKLYKPGFKPIEKTKEYAEGSYYQLTRGSPDWSTFEISRFWIELAERFLNQDRNPFFMSQGFLYLNGSSECATMLSFMNLSAKAEYDTAFADDVVSIRAKSNIIVLVKEQKPLPYVPHGGVLISQSVYEVENRYGREEDGTKIQRSVSEYRTGILYGLETVVINASVSRLDLQTIISIPEGSVPVGNLQAVKCLQEVMEGYGISQYNHSFYFPDAGEFTLLPCSASRNRVVIAKAPASKIITVVANPSSAQVASLNKTVLGLPLTELVQHFSKLKREAIESVIVNERKLLGNAAIYSNVVRALRELGHFSAMVWMYCYKHMDVPTALEYLNYDHCYARRIDIFEYSPLSPNRIHRFMNQGKNTILNIEFRATYRDLLLRMLMMKGFNEQPRLYIVLAYYLLLQDRVPEAQLLLGRIRQMGSQQPNKFPLLQYDYICCYVDLCTGQPDFAVAKALSAKYLDYPIGTWRNLFRQVHELLTSHGKQLNPEASANTAGDIRVVNLDKELRIELPPNSQLRIDLIAINLELMFSASPFSLSDAFSPIKPFDSLVFESGQEPVTKLYPRPLNQQSILVQPLDISKTKRTVTVSGFLWFNPEVKMRVLPDQGFVQIYVEGSARPGVYCKVYGQQQGKSKFVKDGYTDIKGRFKYATYDLQQFQRFAILSLTDSGGVVKVVNAAPH